MDFYGLELHKTKQGYYFQSPEIAEEWAENFMRPYTRASREYRDLLAGTNWREARRTETHKHYMRSKRLYQEARDLIRAEFMKRYGLKESTAYRCLGKLIEGRSHTCYAAAGCYFDPNKHPPALGWFDHSEIFWQPASESYAFTTQPYDLQICDVKSLLQWGEPYGLDVSISYSLAWHYPGTAPLVVVVKQEFAIPEGVKVAIRGS